MREEQGIVCVRFGAFELQPRERRLLHDGEPTVLGPRAFNLLVALVERAGLLVSKDELLEVVWPNLVVEENNLQVQVSTLRKILGPGAIATIPGHGYRFTLTPKREAAPLAAPATYNLPRQVTSFVGRARELREIGALLDQARLLTLVGFGGIGKTRLALQMASGVVDAYPDGVWLVELAPLLDARLVPQAVASVLGVREEPGRPVLEALLTYVAGRRLLLILDSCEHLLQACAELAGELLQAAAHLKLLVTSRERLRVAGEASYPVLPLAWPELDSAISLCALGEYEAVRLFLDRAIAAQPALQLTKQNAAAVAEICRRVDGIPLATELAAARARMLPVEKIAERLRDRFRLLTHGDPRALPHRQTLRATIDWSYGLLTEPERALLQRLAVFAGGFTLEAAEAACAGGDVKAIDVLDLLTELVEKSLVVVESGAERYRLFDSVREYAQERLDESGDGDQFRSQHLAFYLALAEEAEPQVRGQEAGVWLARLDRERANFLAAHAWCDSAAGGGQLGLRLVCGLRNFWLHRGHMEMGLRAMAEALSRPGAMQRTSVRCATLLDAGTSSNELGRFAKAKGYLEESLSIAEEVGRKDLSEGARRQLGIGAYAVGDTTEAQRHFEQALALARELGKSGRLIGASTAMAEFHRGEGNLDAAESLYEEALEISRANALGLHSVIILLNLARTCIGRGSRHRALAMLVEAFDVVGKTGSRWIGQPMLDVCAGLAAFLQRWEQAARFYGASEEQLRQISYHRDRADEVFLAPLIAKTREALAPSAFASAEADGRALSYDDALADARAWLRRVDQSP
jgi:non-specific serine/threonine protein kinase